MKKAILFDLDGVLVKSMPFHLEAWQWAFEQHQIPVSLHTLALHEGFRSADMARKIARAAQVQIDDSTVKEIVKIKRAYYQKIAQVEFYPQALEVVTELKKMKKCCAIVTSCVRASLQRAIPAEHIPLFNYIVTGDEIKNGKPNPDPFLLARDKLQVTSEECVVIENAPLGIQAAKTAGMVCIAITTTLSANELSGADYIVNHLREIVPIIEKMN